MYLGMLKKEEKELFLQLAITLASVDGNYSDIEKAMIDGYCAEMGINSDISVNKSPKEIAEKFNRISIEQTKKIVLFEAIGLALSDNSFDEHEKNLISSIANYFHLDDKFIEACKKIILEYLGLQQRINELVLDTL